MRNDQCYFDADRETGELLVHDISEKNDPGLHGIVYDAKGKEEPGCPQV